jgi:hypothetical protein
MPIALPTGTKEQAMRASSYFPAIDAMVATVADGRFDIRQAEGGEQYRNRSHRAASFFQ